MFRETTPTNVDCELCGKPFALNATMLARVREVEARGLGDRIAGFICLECSEPLGPPEKPRASLRWDS